MTGAIACVAANSHADTTTSPIHTTRQELLARGWTATMIANLLPEPDAETYATGRHRVTVYRWPVDVVERVMAGVEWQAANSRLLKLRASRARRVAEALAENQARRQKALAAVRDAFPIWQDAIPAAAEAMHQLNRLASDRSTYGRQEIYVLKNMFIQTLYEAQCFSRVEVHIKVLPPKECYRCEGTGTDPYLYDECRRCDGTGEYMPATTIESLCFYGTINGVDYSWHQPRDLIHYDVRVNGATRPMPALPERRAHTLDAFEMRGIAKLVVAYVAKKGDVSTADCD